MRRICRNRIWELYGNSRKKSTLTIRTREDLENVPNTHRIRGDILWKRQMYTQEEHFLEWGEKENCCLHFSNVLRSCCRGAIHGSRWVVRFRRNVEEIGTMYRREWCSAQRIRITMIAGGNHSIIQMNGSPTVGFGHFDHSERMP